MSKVPNGWTPEDWQKQMYAEVAVAYRLSALGALVNEDAITSEEMAEVDAQYRHWLEQHEKETNDVALAWERERFDRLWQLEMDICKCEEAMQHLKVRMGRTQSGIDYKLEFGDNE